MNEPEKALQTIYALKEQCGASAELLMAESYSLFLMNRKEEAERIMVNLSTSSNLDEDSKNRAEFNLNVYDFDRDNLQEGLRKFLIFGQKIDHIKKYPLPFKKWQGQRHVLEKNIVVQSDAGIGDEIVNIRFLDNLKDRGLNPVYFTEREDMVRMFRRNGYNAEAYVTRLPKTSVVWCGTLELPYLLRLNQEELWKGPYLTHDVSLPVPESITSETRLKVGIRWQGNVDYDNDLHRTLPLDDMVGAIRESVDCRLYSLQRDAGIELLRADHDVVNLVDHLTDFESTMAMIANLDVVVTSCTSIAHASAAMGKRTIVLVPISTYYIWRYSDKHSHSPWYGDHVTTLKQTTPREWKTELDQLKEILNHEYNVHH
jgi:hypothetical protein